MEIIDKTNETWKIGDIVIDNDERKGIIKKTKDDDFVIVRFGDGSKLDEKFRMIRHGIQLLTAINLGNYRHGAS